MKKVMTIGVAAAVMVLTSCGGDSKKIEVAKVKPESTSVSGDLSDTSSSSASSEDWDAVLDDYEEYVDKYIKFYKKAMKGDLSAMTEYPALMEKATSFDEKLENAKGDMSASQVGRMAKIQTKMLQAATGN